MIHDLVHTTCTKNIVKCQERTQWKRSTRIWLLVIGLDLGLSMYVSFRIESSCGHFTKGEVQILKVVELEKTDDVKRPYIKQLIAKKLKFPLPHRVPKSTIKRLFAAQRPSTFA